MKKILKSLAIDKDYGHKTVFHLKRKIKHLKHVFVTLNIFILFAALTTSIFAILVTAYLAHALPWWYPYLTAGIGAFTTFTTSLLNFFIVRDKIKIYHHALNKIHIEINKYDSKLVNKYKGNEKDWHLFIAIEAIMNNDAAKMELINE